MKSITKILLLGPPACGKGTQARRLSELLNLPVLGTGNLLRQAVADQSELGKKAEGFISQGLYVPDSLIESLVLEWASAQKNGWIFDGFPRTQAQAQFMLTNDSIGKPDLVIGLRVGKEELEKRVNSRRQCTQCDIVTSTFVHPEENCPDVKCKGYLYARNDDALESFKVRHTQYLEHTEPLFDYFDNQGILAEIYGEGPPEKVWKKVEKLVD